MGKPRVRDVKQLVPYKTANKKQAPEFKPRPVRDQNPDPPTWL